MLRLLGAALIVGASLLTGCAGSARDELRWTEREAESITTVRSLPVRVLDCKGLGAAEVEDEQRSFARFDCVGGTRAAWETYDTIAVYYLLRPLEPYDGPRSRHRLTRVRFVGGPGVP
jgi:hypothetical protein